MKTRLLAIFIFAIFIGCWQVVCALKWVSPILLPSPFDVGKYLISSMLDGVLLSALGVTLSRLAIGYVMGLIFGISIGLLLYHSFLARSTLGVVALGLQTLPSVCWAPLALLWFGQSENAMYFVVIMGSMWAITLSTKEAITSVPPIYVQAARVMGSRGFHAWRTVVFPAALPQLANGARMGWAFAWRSLMAAEIYVTIISRFGVGQLLHFGRELHAMDQAVGVMVVIVLVGFLSEKFIFTRCKLKHT
ncbi:MAG: ABC transporter permease [Deltaproteobacteria bacterium]|jgi:NitT/TauT family transport system permease protein|nr:ABC transporter permease [Deltaproteobacteria bacterium]